MGGVTSMIGYNKHLLLYLLVVIQETAILCPGERGQRQITGTKREGH